MKVPIFLAAGILCFTACSDTGNREYESPATTNDVNYNTPPESNTNTQQHLDTAVDDMRTAGQKAKENLQDFGENVKESAREAKQDVKASAERAKTKADRDRETIKRKTNEAREEMRNN